MIFFLLIFLSLYSAINFYFFFKAKSALHFSGKMEVVIIISIIFLILAPIVIKIVEKLNLEVMARLIAYCGYLWMAFVFLFFFLHISFDLFRIVSKIFSHNAGMPPARNACFVMAVVLAFSFVVYGFFDAQKIRIKRLQIHSEKLSPDYDVIRIVQISDVHIGLIVREKRLQNVLEKVQDAKPDILVSTGDLLDGELDHVEFAARQLAAIKPRFGKYAVTGNHEYYAGIEKALNFTKIAGFKILRDERTTVAGMNIIGLEDPTGRERGWREKNIDWSSLFPDKQQEAFTLLLKHQPTIREDKNFDLQLSGHTHGGQIFPFMFLTRIFFPKNSGYHQLSDNKSVYISKGAGTWGPPVRFFAPPEITIIDVIKK